MSLRKRFKVNAKVCSEGIWINYPDDANEDGTIPGFLIGRMSTHNKAFAKLNRDIAARKIDLSATALDSQEALTEELKKEYIADGNVNIELFLGSILKGWRNFQPDTEGVVVEYTPETATAYLGHADWTDLYLQLQDKALESTIFTTVVMEADAKNLPRSLPTD